jgi:hypothetical protein
MHSTSLSLITSVILERTLRWLADQISGLWAAVLQKKQKYHSCNTLQFILIGVSSPRRGKEGGWEVNCGGVPKYIMGGCLGKICPCLGGEGQDEDYRLTEEEKEEQRAKAAAAAEARAQNFQQGGGGERLKAKAAAREKIEKERPLTGPNSEPAMRWQV